MIFERGTFQTQVRAFLLLLDYNVVVDIVPAWWLRGLTWVYDRSLTGLVRSNPTGGMDACLFFDVVCCQVEVSATGRSLVQRRPTECCLSECDHEATIARSHLPSRAVVP